MIMRTLLLCLTGLLLSTGVARAQFGLQTGLLRDRIWSQSYNPANLAFSDYETFQFGSQANGWFGNNHAAIEGVFAENNTITTATANRIVSELSNRNVINAGYSWELASVNLKFGERKWGFYLNQGLSATAGFDEPRTLGLILNGNGPYKGDTITENEIFGNVRQWRSLGAGTTFDLGEKIKLGVRLNLLQGSRLFNLESSSYQFYTSQNGTTLDLEADYTFYNTPAFRSTGIFDFNGFGASAGAGIVAELNDKMTIEAAVTEMGVISWSTDKNTRVVRLEDFEGIVINSILTDSLDGLLDNQVDSLTNLVLPDSTRENYIAPTPMRIRAGWTYKIGENGLLNATVAYSPFRRGSYTALPLISVAYQHEVAKGLRLSANAYGGGYDNYGFGLMGTYRIDAGKAKIDILIGSDNFMGLLIPSVGKGMNLFGGVGLTIN